MMRLVFFLVGCLLIAVNGTNHQASKETSCNDLYCKAGRECVMVEERPQCLCVISCPDHFKPICGSDGKSYENHCKLHQRVCLSGEHIRIEHKGYCKNKKKKKINNKEWLKDREHSLLSKKDLEKEIQNDLVENLREQTNERSEKTSRAVCYGPQRNAMRFLLIDHWQKNLKDQPWYTEGTTYRESLWSWFYTCDNDKDNLLSSHELFKCSKSVAFFARPGQDNSLTKELCVGALVDDGDKNDDLTLDIEEFARIMNPKYHLTEKNCSLEGKEYQDGEELDLICDQCVCALGSWACTSVECDEDKKKKSKKPEIINNSIDDRYSEPPSADDWMQKALDEKIIAKELFRSSKISLENIDRQPTTETVARTQKDQPRKIDLAEQEDYFHDDVMYEKTKSKKKQQIQDTIKKAKLSKIKRKHEKEIAKSKKLFKQPIEIEKNSSYKKVSNDRKKNKRMFRYNLKKYEGDLFEKSLWNDLISSNKEITENQLF